jgi:hypothetical protein
MDTAVIWTIIGTTVGTIGIIYTFLRNFKTDINKHIDAVTTRLDTHITETKQDNAKRDNIIMQTNARMDGVYNLLLKKAENLKG